MEIWRLKFWTHERGHEKKEGSREKEKGKAEGKGKIK